MDDWVMEQARKRADDIAPLPSDSPGTAATKGAGAAFGISLIFLVLERADIWVAAAIAIFVSATVMFLESKQKWDRHHREYREALHHFNSMKERADA